MNYGRVESDLFILINQLRKKPSSFVGDLEAMAQHYQDSLYNSPTSNVTFVTEEGTSAVHEAIAFLKSAEAAPEFQKSKGLTLAAQAHAKDLGQKGLVSHDGSDSTRLNERVDRVCTWNGALGENIVFEEPNPIEILLLMLVEDGNPARGHRKNLLNPDFSFLGIAAGPHTQFKHCAVLNFASWVGEREPRKDDSKGQAATLELPKPKDREREKEKEREKERDRERERERERDREREREKERDREREKIENEDAEFPPDVQPIKVKRFISTIGKKRITKIEKTFRLKDGTEQMVEEIEEEFLP